MKRPFAVHENGSRHETSYLAQVIVRALQLGEETIELMEERSPRRLTLPHVARRREGIGKVFVRYVLQRARASVATTVGWYECPNAAAQ